MLHPCIESSHHPSSPNIIDHHPTSSIIIIIIMTRVESHPLYFTDRPFEEAIDPRVLTAFRLPQHTQRTAGWYEARKTCITASSLAAALMQVPSVTDYYLECFPEADFKPNPKKTCSFKDTRLDLIMDKCGLGDGFKGNEYTAWGQKYEEVVSNIYAQMHKVDLLEFGLLIHPVYDYVGASPDGIIAWALPDGTVPMLEVKCPPSRQVKPYPPIYYFIQMMVQMECTGMTECDYFDANFVEYVDVAGWEADAEAWEAENPTAIHHQFGIILAYETLEDDEDVIKHVYAPPTVVKKDVFLQWADTYEEENPDTIYSRTHYKLHRYYISRVKAKHEWFMDNLPAIRETWDRILEGRTPAGYAALKRIKGDKEQARLRGQRDRANRDAQGIVIH